MFLKPVRGGVAVAFAVGLMACQGSERTRGPSPESSALTVSTRQGVHGMVVFGDQAQFLYHLPMWHGLHAWQIVLEVRPDAEGERLYVADRASGSPLVTFEPQPFALASLKPGARLEGTLFHGHFEQGGTPLPSAGAASRVSFTVQRLLRVKALSPTEPPAPAGEYWLVGGEGERYGVHVARHAPDFDHILRLDAPRAIPGHRVMTTGLQNRADGRPREGTTWTGLLEDGSEVPFTVVREEYFSTADLGGT
ncbi:MAG: hypothetical protein ABW123_12030 [Cystobacter sp.]